MHEATGHPDAGGGQAEQTETNDGRRGQAADNTRVALRTGGGVPLPKSRCDLPCRVHHLTDGYGQAAERPGQSGLHDYATLLKSVVATRPSVPRMICPAKDFISVPTGVMGSRGRSLDQPVGLYVVHVKTLLIGCVTGMFR
jgi:hypothetical protein